MNIFIFRSIKFAFIALVIIVTVVVSVNLCIQYSKSKHSLDKNINMLILGHSHSERAYNDSIISNSLNLSQGGDSYFYNYLKLKALISHNPQIKYVILNFSNNQIDIKMNERIWDELHMSYKFVKLSAYADFEDNYLLLKNNPQSYFSSISLGTRKNIDILAFNESKLYQTKEWGAFLQTKKAKNISNLEKKIANQNVKILFSKANINYLKKIVAICNKANLKLFFIRTPVYPTYSYLSNESKFDSIYNQDFSEIKFIDLKDFPLGANQFEDESHLNYKGSDSISRFMSRKIKNGFLDFNNWSRITYSELNDLN